MIFNGLRDNQLLSEMQRGMRKRKHKNETKHWWEMRTRSGVLNSKTASLTPWYKKNDDENKRELVHKGMA